MFFRILSCVLMPMALTACQSARTSSAAPRGPSSASVSCSAVPDLSKFTFCDLQVKTDYVNANYVQITCDGSLVHLTQYCLKPDDGSFGGPGSVSPESLMTSALKYSSDQNFKVLKLDGFRHALMQR